MAAPTAHVHVGHHPVTDGKSQVGIRSHTRHGAPCPVVIHTDDVRYTGKRKPVILSRAGWHGNMTQGGGHIVSVMAKKSSTTVWPLVEVIVHEIATIDDRRTRSLFDHPAQYFVSCLFCGYCFFFWSVSISPSIYLISYRAHRTRVSRPVRAQRRFRQCKHARHSARSTIVKHLKPNHSS